MLTIFNLRITFCNPIYSPPSISQIPKSITLFSKRFTYFCFQKPPMPRSSSPSTKIVAEYAKSNRSSCKKCSEAIDSKALRLGLLSRDARGFDVTKWHHLDCFTFGSESVASAEAIKGFESLKVWCIWVLGVLSYEFCVVCSVRKVREKRKMYGSRESFRFLGYLV